MKVSILVFFEIFSLHLFAAAFEEVVHTDIEYILFSRQKEGCTNI